MSASDITPSKLPGAVTTDIGHMWGDAQVSSSEQVNEALLDVQADLSSFVADIRRGPLKKYGAEVRAYFEELHREFLRHHRRLLILAREGLEPADQDRSVRLELAELSERFRGIVLSRASKTKVSVWHPSKIVRAAERLVEAVPLVIEAPYEQASLESTDEDAPIVKMIRSTLRLRHRWSRRRRPTRQVRLRLLTKRHIRDRFVVNLEGVAASFLAVDDLVLTQSRMVFEQISGGYQSLAVSSSAPLTEQLAQFRSKVEAEMSLAESEIANAIDNVALRIARLLGDGYSELQEEVGRAGTFEASPTQINTSLGEDIVDPLEDQLHDLRAVQSARLTLLGLQLEYLSFRQRVQVRLQERLGDLGRDVRGRSSTQVNRVLEAVKSTRSELAGQDGELDRESSRTLLGPLSRVVDEALKAAVRLQEQLQAETLASPLLNTLNREAQALADGYRVPGGAYGWGEWKIPEVDKPVDVDLGTVVSHYVQSDLAPRLLDSMHEAVPRLDALLIALQDLERVAALDTELLEAEASSDEKAKGQTRQVIDEALGRAQTVFEGLQVGTAAWADEVIDSAGVAISARLDLLRDRLSESEIAKLDRSSPQTVDIGVRVGRITKTLDELGTRSTEVIKGLVGRERLAQLRSDLGYAPGQEARPAEEVFRAPAARCELPLFYRRLFAPHAHWAKDPRPEHERDFERLLSALQPRPQASLRTAGIASTHAAVRTSLSVRLTRHDRLGSVFRVAFNKPTSADDVQEALQEVGQGQLVVVTGLRWLITSAPGGFLPLRTILERVVQDRSQNAFVFEAPRLVWRYASGFAPLDDVVAAKVELRPLEARELELSVRSRHQLSGYTLLFQQGKEYVDDGELAQRYFDTLHERARGSAALALTLFTASLDAVDASAGFVKVGSLPDSPHTALEALDQDTKLRLHYVLRQGWADASSAGHVEGISIGAAVGRLERLALMGLLRREAGGVFSVPQHLGPHLETMFQEAGWLR